MVLCQVGLIVMIPPTTVRLAVGSHPSVPFTQEPVPAWPKIAFPFDCSESIGPIDGESELLVRRQVNFPLERFAPDCCLRYCPTH